MYVYSKGTPKPRAVTPPCNLWVHNTTSKERTDDNILISKPLPGEGTHKRKSNRRTYLQEARREYCGKLKGYNGRRGISHQRQRRKWEKRTTVSISESGENYLGRLRRPSSVMGLSGQRGWKKGLRSRRLLSTHHALLLTLADLTRGELLHQGRHVLLNFFCVQTQRRKRAIEDFGNKEIILKSWGYQCHSQWIHALCQGKVRASELSVNPQTAMFHIYHDKLQRCLLTLKQIQTNSGRAKQNGKKKLAWSLPEVTNNNQFFLEVLQVSIRSAINRWLRFKTWNHP